MLSHIVLNTLTILLLALFKATSEHFSKPFIETQTAIVSLVWLATLKRSSNRRTLDRRKAETYGQKTTEDVAH